jgi:hypothetical protein
MTQTRTFNRSGYYSKSLTNYFIASNQIVNQLRKQLNDANRFARSNSCRPRKPFELRSPRSTFDPSGASLRKNCRELSKPAASAKEARIRSSRITVALELLQDCLKTTMESETRPNPADWAKLLPLAT